MTITDSSEKISFQGNPGAYSDMACHTVFPDMETVPCKTFADAFDALDKDKVEYAMIPIDNAIAGRVADIHQLLPNSGFYIQQEYFMPIHHCLLGVKGSKTSDIKHIYSHIHALPQCRNFTKPLAIEEHVFGDTARSAQKVFEMQDKTCAAIASSMAAELYNLDILEENIEDADYNKTRFVVLSKESVPLKYDPKQSYITSLIFNVRNIPAVLYKALGGFATNNVNLTKLESYMEGGKFTSTQFYCEIEAHPEQKSLQLALDELKFFATHIKSLGTYKADPFRKTI